MRCFKLWILLTIFPILLIGCGKEAPPEMKEEIIRKFVEVPFSGNRKQLTIKIRDLLLKEGQPHVIATDREIFLNTEKDVFRRVTLPGAGGNLKIRCLMWDRMGKIYAGTSDGLYESATGTSFIRYDIGHVNAIAEDGNGIIWCGTKTGLKKMNGKNVTTYKKSNSTLPHDDVLCLTRDSKGAVWAGTVQGVAELSDAGVVKVYTGSYYEPLMSGGLVVRPGNTAMEGNTISKIIFMGEGEAFVGTNRGLNRTIGFTSFKHFSGDSQEPSKMPDGSLGYKKQAGNSPLLANFIRALEFSPEGKLLIGTRPGISIFDPTTEEWSSITKGELEFPGGAVNVIRSAGKGYFVGTDNGLFQMQTIVRKVPVK